MRRSLGVLALVAVGAALAWPMQVTGDNQNSHYALVKALADGVPYVDRTLPQTGDLQSHDVAHHGGHIYAVKAPGLAIAALPTYLVVEAVGMRTTGDPTRVLWVLTLFTSVLATIVLLFLVRDIAERLEPGYGTVTAVVLGLGALTLQFGTLFFAHALETSLAFAAFWVLFRERRGAPRLVVVAAAGLLAGLAATVEYSAIWIGAVLTLYAVVRGPALRRGAAFLGAAAVGVAPVLAFNAWAFGNPFHSIYSDNWREHRELASKGLWFAAPSWHELSRLLFSSLGLLTLAPVLVAGAAGAVLLGRSGRRAEALVSAGVALALIVYFSGWGAFGGLGPPRYVTAIVPFLLFPLALVLRRRPLTTLALAAVTCAQAVVMTSTGPLAAYDGDWLHRAAHRNFVGTAASLVGISGWYSIGAYFLAAAVALALAVAVTPLPRPAPRDAGLAVAAVVGWAIVAAASWNDWGHTPSVPYVIGMSVLALVAALAVSLAPARGSRRIASAGP